MEERLVFGRTDLAYLANLCHNCGECLYACQFAPPHEFGIDVPRLFAQIRLRTYEEYCWPRFMAGAYARTSVGTAVGLSILFAGVLLAAVLAGRPDVLWRAHGAGEFYEVVPHTVLITLFGAVSLFVLAALGTGAARCWRDVRGGAPGPIDAGALLQAVRDAATLRHLHASGDDCTAAEEVRTPWRRYFHHLTFYGFLLCFASTSAAAFYHSVLRLLAPYPYWSLPVVLGVLGGIGLIAGPAGPGSARHGQRIPGAAADRQRDGAGAAGLARERLDAGAAAGAPGCRPRTVRDHAVRQVRACRLQDDRPRAVRPRVARAGTKKRGRLEAGPVSIAREKVEPTSG
jgi:citrate/tricarballylate utilization protein